MPPTPTSKKQLRLTTSATPDLVRRARILAAARNLNVSVLLTTLVNESFAQLPVPIQNLTWSIGPPSPDILAIAEELHIPIQPTSEEFTQ